MADAKKSRFLKGMVLAWLPCVFFLFPIARWIPDSLPGIEMAAGSRVLYAIPMLPCEVAALFFLLRSFSRAHPLRTVFSGITVLCSAALIAMLVTALFSAIGAAF